uniref:30 kDa salivary gland allergen-like n=1 Tax=Toxorhynchites amboinensis TaxID=46208 RepID=A0FIV2_TOXAM|nr:30 kDa salivary gland allergen-like [Toxorhynchites amboinensis]
MRTLLKIFVAICLISFALAIPHPRPDDSDEESSGTQRGRDSVSDEDHNPAERRHNFGVNADSDERGRQEPRRRNDS